MDLELGNHVNPELRNHLILGLGNHVNFFTVLLGNDLIADTFCSCVFIIKIYCFTIPQKKYIN